MRPRASSNACALRYKKATRTWARCVHCANGSVRDSNCRRNSASSMFMIRLLTAILVVGLAGATSPGQSGDDDAFALKKVAAHDREPLRVVKKADGHVFVDFGRDAFGWLQ